MKKIMILLIAVILTGITSCKKEEAVKMLPSDYTGKTVYFTFTVKFDQPVDFTKYEGSFSFLIEFWPTGAEVPRYSYQVDYYFHSGKTTDMVNLKEIYVIREQQAAQLIGCRYKILLLGHLLSIDDPEKNWKIKFNPEKILPAMYKETREGENNVIINAEKPFTP